MTVAATTMDVNVGPQHPGSGHFRLLIKVDGDFIVSVDPDPGYVHRGIEKIAEYRNYIKMIPVIERPTIIDAANKNLGYVLPIEELQQIQVPQRGQYIRVLIAEINRITSHLYWLAINAGVFSGHTTIFMWAFGDRELFINLAEMLTGARLTFSFIVPGGVRRDLPYGFKQKTLETVNYFEKRLNDYDRMFFSNPLIKMRTQGVGVLKREDAIRLGVVGPNLRASGVKFDVRKIEPYAAYDGVDFELPTFNEGDCYSRFLVRFFEMKQSMRIIRQILEDIPKGPVARKAPLVVPRGEALGRVESARGELCYYLIADGGDKPYRLKITPGSLRSLAALVFLLKDVHIGDMPVIYGSLDYWPVEADR